LIKIKCPKCKEITTDILKIHDIHSVGLALFGNCPECKTMVSISELWRKDKHVRKSKFPDLEVIEEIK
jgi:phage FluMu protein Com